MADSTKSEAQETKALNDLIATCRDAEEGFAKAAKGVHDHELSDRLTAISGERGRFADELAQFLSGYGAEPAHDAHYGGILHRGWVDLEARIRPKSEHDLIQDCLHGDGDTLKHYDHALGMELPTAARALVERQRQAVAEDLAFLESRLQEKRAQGA